MSEYKVRYVGSKKQYKVSAESPRLAYKSFIEKIEIVKEDAVEVWNGTNWVKFEGHTAVSNVDSAGTQEKSFIKAEDFTTESNSPADIFGPNNKISLLLRHRQNLRVNTAYPVLRLLNILNSIVIVLGFIFWGNALGNGALVAVFIIIGPLLALLNYSIVSVFYDVADATINTSRNTEKISKSR